MLCDRSFLLCEGEGEVFEMAFNFKNLFSVIIVCFLKNDPGGGESILWCTLVCCLEILGLDNRGEIFKTVFICEMFSFEL